MNKLTGDLNISILIGKAITISVSTNSRPMKHTTQAHKEQDQSKRFLYLNR
jgi:hypothetical protein